MSYSFEPVTIPSVEELDALASSSAGVLDSPDPTAPPELPDLQNHAHPQPGFDSDNSDAGNERAVEKARAVAHQQGFEEGRRAEAERVRTLVEAVNVTLEELRQADVRREAEAADRIAALSTAVAGHLIEREVHAAPEIISDLVRRAVTEFPVNESLAVHLNPTDLALLSSGLSDESAREHLTSGQTVRWIPDPAIRSGGCLVEGEERVVDARLSIILDRVFKALTDA